MSFDHKSYRFQWSAFEAELSQLLLRALARNDPGSLEQFIDANVLHCSTPWEGEPLDSDWRSLLDTSDVQALGDLALTKFYDPKDDFGINGKWLSLSETLPPEQQAALTGSIFGPPGTQFDPGQMGSYFQHPRQVLESARALASIQDENVIQYRQALEAIGRDGDGVYVTF